VITDLNNNVELVLREYNLKWDTDTYLEVYTADDVTTYNVSAGFKVVANELHRFGTVPLSVCKANEDSKSLIDDIKSLNDAYNNVLSDLVNEVSDFRQCFMTVTGATITNESILSSKATGVIVVPDGAEISYLVKDINDSFVKNLLQELEEKMYKIVSTIDSNEKMQSNTSSVALRSRLYLLENTCGLIQGYLEQAIRNRLKLFSSIQINESDKFDYKDIKIKFTANIPSDLLGLADIISKLKDVVSQKTLLTLLPFVENADLELQRFQEQRNSELDLLDKVGLNDV
jgi:SPP1 family phage portal protein